jgi:hypothetical protein
MAADFSGITAEVERIKAVRPAVVALINGIAAKVQAAVDADNAGDNTLLSTLSADVKTEADAFAEAVAAHTVAEPEPTP